MHPFFAPLSDRDVVLLLTTLTVGGSDHVDLFSFLPAPVRAPIQEKAQALVAIPAEKRVQFMVRELKNAVARSGRVGAEKADPSWIIHFLKGENARVVGALLVDMPPPLVRSILKRLPPGIRQALPPKEALRHIAPDVARNIRQLFERHFYVMPGDNPAQFAFRTIVHLDRRDLSVLTRDLGLLELGQAFVTVGKMALVELCRRLPKDKTAELVEAVRSASTIDLPDAKSAQRFLSKVVVNFADTEEFFQKSGLWRLARASAVEDEAFHLALMQRLPRGPGQAYVQFVAKAHTLGEQSEDVLRRLQDSILIRVYHLSRQHQLDERWAHMQLIFHDADAANAALQEKRPEVPTPPPSQDPSVGEDSVQ